MAAQEAALTALPTKVHEKLARKLKAEVELLGGVFKFVISSLHLSGVFVAFFHDRTMKP
jgi:hypothetical protein